MDASYIEEFDRGERQMIAELGMELVANQRYEFGAADFSSQVTAAQAANPDCVMVGDFAPIPQQIMVQGRQLGLTAPFIDYCVCGTAQAAVEVAGEDYVGYIIGEMIPFERPADTLLGMVSDEWESRFDTRLTSYGAWGYDGVLVVAEAIALGAETREELLDFIPEVDIPGLTTQLNFNEELRPRTRSWSLLSKREQILMISSRWRSTSCRWTGH